LKKLASVIQHLRPNVIMLNEIAYDAADGPDVPAGEAPGSNARRVCERDLAGAQSDDVEALHFTAFIAPTESGVTSGMDLDKNGKVVTTYPAPASPFASGSLSPEAKEYAGDCWGFGAFPGQGGMALLVDSRLNLLTDQVRTFRLLPWDYMTGAAFP